MKIFLGLLGILCAFYTIAGALMVVSAFRTNSLDSAYGTSKIAASLVPMCLAAAGSIACFRYVFRKPES